MQPCCAVVATKFPSVFPPLCSVMCVCCVCVCVYVCVHGAYLHMFLPAVCLYTLYVHTHHTHCTHMAYPTNIPADIQWPIQSYYDVIKQLLSILSSSVYYNYYKFLHINGLLLLLGRAWASPTLIVTTASARWIMLCQYVSFTPCLSHPGSQDPCMPWNVPCFSGILTCSPAWFTTRLNSKDDPLPWWRQVGECADTCYKQIQPT